MGFITTFFTCFHDNLAEDFLELFSQESKSRKSKLNGATMEQLPWILPQDVCSEVGRWTCTWQASLRGPRWFSVEVTREPVIAPLGLLVVRHLIYN